MRMRIVARNTDTAESETTTQTADDSSNDDHLDDIDAGAGCAEIWEKLSERRDK